MSDLPPEFSLIARHFSPLAGEGALNLQDDAAVLTPRAGRSLVVAADAMVAGVHFLPDDPPGLIGRKLLRVNLSDLAAMGADPFGYLITLSAPHGTPDAWFAAFAAGLAEDQSAFGVALLGGDTTATPGPLTLSCTVLGDVLPGREVRRLGATAGDGLWVTGTIGDGALGLLALQGKLPDPEGVLADRYRLPRPRLNLLGPEVARAAMDVSDGLVQDAGQLCRAAGLAAWIEAEAVPRSGAARTAGEDRLATCLTGGDDYELLMAVGPEQEGALREAAERIGVPVTRIGMLEAGPPKVSVRRRNGMLMPLPRGGWSHF